MLELTGFLGLTRISFFLLTQIPLYCCVGGKSHRWFCVWAGSHGFRLIFGLTRISQIPRYCFVGGKSHRCFCAWVARADSTLLLGSHGSHRSHSIAVWVGNLTDGSACGLARTDSTLLLGSHGSHRSHGIALWVGNLTDASVCGWLVRIPLCFWAHTDLTDPTVLLCGWEISQMALWVWAPGGCTGLALTDLSFGPFGQIRPIGQIGRIGHF